VVAEPGNAPLREAVEAVMQRYAATLDAELAQRAVEYRGLAARGDVAAAALQPLPKWERRASLLLRRLAEKEVGGWVGASRPSRKRQRRLPAAPRAACAAAQPATWQPQPLPLLHPFGPANLCRTLQLLATLTSQRGAQGALAALTPNMLTPPPTLAHSPPPHTHTNTRCAQGEDADEARERPAWMQQESADSEGLASPAASGGAPPPLGLPAAAPAGGANGAADLLDLLGGRQRPAGAPALLAMPPCSPPPAPQAALCFCAAAAARSVCHWHTRLAACLRWRAALPIVTERPPLPTPRQT
jgi:hypothetical protein